MIMAENKTFELDAKTNLENFKEYLEKETGKKAVVPESVEITETGKPGIKGFTRTYRFAITNGAYNQFMLDDNWYHDSSVSITFLSSEGPTSINVLGYARENVTNTVNSRSWNLAIGQGVNWPLPFAGNCFFSLGAISNNSISGTITIRVTLS